MSIWHWLVLLVMLAFVAGIAWLILRLSKRARAPVTIAPPSSPRSPSEARREPGSDPPSRTPQA